MEVHLEAGVGSEGLKGFEWEDLVYLFHLKIQRKAEIMKVGGRKCWWLFMKELVLCSLHVVCILSIFIC